MEPEKMSGWLKAVEYLTNTYIGNCIENDYGDYIRVGNTPEGRYKKFRRGPDWCEYCGATDSAAEAVLWLYENNKPDEEF